MSEARRAFDGWWNLSTEILPKNDEYKIVTIVDERGDTPYKYVDFGFYLESANKWIVHDEVRTDVVAWATMPIPFRGERRSE